ncbi:MAG: hypothetical protein NZ108_05380, partial [Bacteroidia bacterium]|nr:hypothetical protein [Bacteroidia bacterium]
MEQLSYISNAEPAYLDGLYQTYKNNPESVEPDWRRFFEGFEFGQEHSISETDTVLLSKEIAVLN